MARLKGSKDKRKRRNTGYFKKYNPRRAYGRKAGSPNKSDWGSFVQWCRKDGMLPLNDLEKWLEYYVWLKGCISGKPGRWYRSRQRLFIDPCLQFIFGDKFNWEYVYYDWRGRSLGRVFFVDKEEGFKYIRGVQLLRAKRLLSINRKIRRIKRAIAQKQTIQG